jgi:uncharacterized protein
MRYWVWLLCLALLPLSAQAQEKMRMRYHTVHVTGDYRVKATPDIAYVDFSITSENKEAEEAKQKADEQLRAVKEVAKRLGIEEKDLRTGYVSMQPRYTYLENRPPLLDGYTVSYNLTVTVRKLATIGNLVQQLVRAGVTQVNNVRYDLDDSESFKRDALKQAVANAHAKALVLASATGETLGGALRIQEGNVSYSPPVMAYAMEARMVGADAAMSKSGGEAPPAGELDVSASVTIVYELQN